MNAGEGRRPESASARSVVDRRATAEFALLLAILTLAVRVAFVPVHRFAPERTFTPDSSTYLDLAHNLAVKGVFARNPGAAPLAPESPGTFEVFRTPGYPILLAALMRLDVPPVPAVIVLQIVLDVGAVVLTFLLALTLVPARWAFATGLVLVVDVARVVYANMVMSDVLFTFLISAALWLVAGASGRPTARRVTWAAAALTLATAVRPVGLLTVVPFGIFMAMRGAGRRLIALFTVIALAFPIAWTVRNGVSTGTWAPSNAFDYNLCLVAAAKVKARAEAIPRAEAERQLVESAVSQSPGSDVSRRTAAFRRVGWQVLARHPFAAAREAVLSCLELAFAGERRNLLRLVGAPANEAAAIGEGARTPRSSVEALARGGALVGAIVISQLAWNGALWLLAMFGAVTLARQGRWPELTLFVLTIAAILGPSLVVANGRLRMPVFAIVALLSMCGLRATILRRQARRAPVAP